MFNNTASTFLCGVYRKSLAVVAKVFDFLSFHLPLGHIWSCAGIVGVIEVVVYHAPPASIACMYVDIFVHLFRSRLSVRRTAPSLPSCFNIKCEGCRLGCALWGWARCCLDSWQRAEIGRLIWCRHWDWKWLHIRTIESLTNIIKMGFSWMWVLHHKCVLAY